MVRKENEMHADEKSPVRKYTVSEARANFKDVVNEVVYTRQPAIVTTRL